MNKTTGFLSCSLAVLLAAGTASAQPLEPMNGEATPATTAADAPLPDAPAAHESDADAPAPVLGSSDTRWHQRPTDWSLGGGIGWSFPNDVTTPNLTSIRYRMISGMAFEALFELRNTSTKVKTDAGSAKESSFDFNVGGTVRYPVVSRGPLDLLVLGGITLGFGSQNPDGPAKSSTLGVSLGWGLALDYWITDHWTVGVAGVNPLFSFQQRKDDDGVGDTTTTFFDAGLIWSPSVLVFAHLYL